MYLIQWHPLIQWNQLISRCWINSESKISFQPYWISNLSFVSSFIRSDAFFWRKKLSACTALTAKNIMRWKLAVKYNMAIEYKCGLTTLPYTELSIVPTLFFLSIFQVTVQLVSKQNLSKQNEWWQLHLFFYSSLF